MIISPSIASSDVLHIADEVDFAEKYFDDIHIDIEDGVVVKGITFGMKMAKGIVNRTRKKTSLHLEVLHPLDYLDDLIEIKPDIVFVQIDCLECPEEVIDKFIEAKLNVGLALTNRDMDKDHSILLDKVQQILVLTAFWDDPQQQFQKTLLDYGLDLAKKYNLKLWLDGGINYQIYQQFLTTDVYAVVMGRAIFSDKNAAIKNYVIK
ncbi:MAG: hypothetical protein ACI4WG_05150 [Erysipelotrichaceae bacterium]